MKSEQAFGQCVALNSIGDGEWKMLVPAGRLNGNDGRTFFNSDPRAVVDDFNARGLSLPVDVNHSQFIEAPKGNPSPAVGWIEALQERAGAIWGRIVWNAAGKAAVDAKEYRYLSPVLLLKDGGIVARLGGAALTNSPNLVMPALNSERGSRTAATGRLARDGDLASFTP